MNLKPYLAAAVLVVVTSPLVLAKGKCTTCPRCCAHCELTIEKESVKKSCFEVACKVICIPKVTFPWQSCCEPKKAFTRTIRVLEKKSYECERCKYKWTAVCPPCVRCATEASCDQPSIPAENR